jgi:hypothetical protein
MKQKTSLFCSLQEFKFLNKCLKIKWLHILLFLAQNLIPNNIPNKRLTMNPTVSNHGAQSHRSFF